MLTGQNMVRRYKKKPFYEAAKIPQETVFKVVACYAMGQSARVCAERTGISRQSAQKLYADFGDRVSLILDGNFPSSNNKLGDGVAKFGDMSVFNELIEVLRQRAGDILRLFGAEITFHDFKRYCDSGSLEIDPSCNETETQTTRFFRYRLFQLLMKYAQKSYGLRETQYPKHYAFCKLYFLVLTVMLTITKQEKEKSGIAHVDLHQHILAQVSAEKQGKLESMIFDAKCQMVMSMLILFSLYERAI